MNITDYEFPAGNVRWEPRDIAALMMPDIGMDSRLFTAVAVVLGESGGDPLATGRAVWSPGAVTHQCFDPKASWLQAFQVLSRDRPDGWHWNWKPWTVYKTGAYDRHMAAAINAVDELALWLAS